MNITALKTFLGKNRDKILHNIKILVQPSIVRLFPSRWYSEKEPDFLILGLQKSGSTWLALLLNNHPEITCIPIFIQPKGKLAVSEGHFFDALGEIDNNPDFFRIRITQGHKGFFNDMYNMIDKLDRQEYINILVKRYNALLQRKKNSRSRLVGDKTPEYIFYLDTIDGVFPQIKKICILRNHYDRIVSFHYHQIRKKRWEHKTIEDWEVESYCDRIEREYSALLEYDGSIYVETYENFSKNPVSPLKDILKYLEVSSNERIIKDIIDQAHFSRLSDGRTRGESDIESHFRKGVVGDGLKEMTKNQRKYVYNSLEGMTHELMKKYSLDLSHYLDY